MDSNTEGIFALILNLGIIVCSTCVGGTNWNYMERKLSCQQKHLSLLETGTPAWHVKVVKILPWVWDKHSATWSSDLPFTSYFFVFYFFGFMDSCFAAFFLLTDWFLIWLFVCLLFLFLIPSDVVFSPFISFCTIAFQVPFYSSAKVTQFQSTYMFSICTLGLS